MVQEAQHGDAVDNCVTMCFYMQKELSYKHEEVLQMPASTFQVLWHEIEGHYKREAEAMKKSSKGSGKGKGKTFG